jgi:hypothetical protein
LKEENEKLRSSLRAHLGAAKAEELLGSLVNQDDETGSFADSEVVTAADVASDDANISFVNALQTPARQNIVVSPDNSASSSQVNAIKAMEDDSNFYLGVQALHFAQQSNSRFLISTKAIDALHASRSVLK